MLLITDLENKVVTSRYYEPFSSEIPMKRAARLSDLNVKTLICGAVSQPLAHMIEGYGIRIIPFVRGEVDQVLHAYLKDILSTPNSRMPGCKDRHHRRCRSRRGCKNK